MGGSSTINSMMYVRGNRRDYDSWAELGNEGWSYNNVLKYFIKLENVTEPNLMSSSYRGKNGPLNVQYSRFHTPLRNDFIKAGEELGWIHRDYNGRTQDNSIDTIQLTVDGASRESTLKAYLNPIRNRNNLSVIKSSFVVKIIINKSKTIATGVKYVRNGISYTVTARKEVILSAGAINTPQLLMLSGIGPKAELNKHGIKLLHDLPVGNNLQDHIAVPISYELRKNVTITTNIWKTKKSIFEYVKNRKGPLTSTGAQAFAFFNPENSRAAPSLAFVFGDFFPEYDNPQYRQIIIITVALPLTFSIGTVRLKSNNPYDHPLIDPNFLSNQYDYDMLWRGIEISFQYIRTSTMKKYSPKYFIELVPNCADLNKNKFIKCLIEQYSSTTYHPCCTAKMGIDKTAVVSPELIVKGFKNLRVIDASIMPVIPRANTNGPTIMIAEKGADIIKMNYNVL